MVEVGGQQKSPPSPHWDERHAFRGTTHASRSPAHSRPRNGGRPSLSPGPLRGEPSTASAVWLSAGDQTSLGGGFALFSPSTHLQMYFISHWRENCKIKLTRPPPGAIMRGSSARKRKRAGCETGPPDFPSPAPDHGLTALSSGPDWQRRGARLSKRIGRD